VSKRISVTVPDDFAALYDKLVDSNPRASSSEVVQEALIALARTRDEGRAKKKNGKPKRRVRGKLPEVQQASDDLTAARMARRRMRREHSAVGIAAATS
jgi:Arc/MetJ-type ribon-helix-helix transcriptional regulator